MKPKLLDLFCGAGGASMGYYRAGFEVEGVDNKPQPHYPFKFYLADALEFPLEGYDAYHASPPCQAYIDRNCNRKTEYPRLIEPTREQLKKTGKLFIIENVYKAPLKATLMLCGTMFGLRVIRHRYFEFSFTGPMSPFTCNHYGTVASGEFIAVYQGGHHALTLPDGTRPFAKETDITTWSEAMGINWMQTKPELKEAIPPAYTEYIGKYLIEFLTQSRGKSG